LDVKEKTSQTTETKKNGSKNKNKNKMNKTRKITKKKRGLFF
jgi:hypothetical protein